MTFESWLPKKDLSLSLSVCFLNIFMFVFVCSRWRPQWTGWVTGGSSSPGQGARVTEAKGKGERGGHGLQSQTQQVHGSGWAPEPRWGVSMLCKGKGSGSVSGCISLGFCCGLSFGALDCMCTCVWSTGAGFRAEKRCAMMFVTCRERGRLWEVCVGGRVSVRPVSEVGTVRRGGRRSVCG